MQYFKDFLFTKKVAILPQNVNSEKHLTKTFKTVK